MAEWKPSLNPDLDLRELPLTPEEGFIASRLDGATDLHGIAVTTGIAAERVAAALEKLVALGAVAPAEQVEKDRAGSHRELFETRLRRLSVEERTALAKACDEPDLSALCFEPLPTVVQALLENPRFALAHAQLLAAHHHTSAGLDALAARAALAADAGVRRALLRNPQASSALLRRLYGGRRLLEQYALATSRDFPEQTRRIARELLRARFATADADERVEVIVKTEGRCLASLSGVPVDGKTAALLCGRTYTSTLLVQNIARWAGAPPALIAHLSKQDLVRRSPALKTLLQRHPNAPAKE